MEGGCGARNAGVYGNAIVLSVLHRKVTGHYPAFANGAPSIITGQIR
jgi:hypothetical protein